MTSQDMKRENMLKIYLAIINGNDTLYSISKTTGISQLTVSNLANELIKREILLVDRPKQSRVGRPTHKYFPSHFYYTVYIEKLDSAFSVFAVSTIGKMVDRFIYTTNKGKLTEQEVLNSVLERIQGSEGYRYCNGIFLLGAKENEYIIPDGIAIMSKEEFIARALADEKKICLFSFNNKPVLSIYSNIQIPNATVEEVNRIIKADDFFMFEGTLQVECYDSLKLMAIKNLLKSI